MPKFTMFETSEPEFMMLRYDLPKHLFVCSEIPIGSASDYIHAFALFIKKFVDRGSADLFQQMRVYRWMESEPCIIFFDSAHADISELDIIQHYPIKINEERS